MANQSDCNVITVPATCQTYANQGCVWCDNAWGCLNTKNGQFDCPKPCQPGQNCYRVVGTVGMPYLFNVSYNQPPSSCYLVPTSCNSGSCTLLYTCNDKCMSALNGLCSVNSNPPVPVPPPPPPTPDGSNPLMGVYIGVPLAIVFSLAIAGCLYVYFQRKRRKNLEKMQQEYPQETVEKTSSPVEQHFDDYDPKYWDVARMSDGRPIAVVPKGTLTELPQDVIVQAPSSSFMAISNIPAQPMVTSQVIINQELPLRIDSRETVVQTIPVPPTSEMSTQRAALWKDVFEDE